MAVPLCANGRSSTTITRHVLWYLAASIFCLVILSDAIKPADAQAYHFSKGWMPGRKRATSAVTPLVGGGHDAIESGTGASAALVEAVRRAMFGSENKDSSPSTVAVCTIRSRVYRLVLDMIRVSHVISYYTHRVSISDGTHLRQRKLFTICVSSGTLHYVMQYSAVTRCNVWSVYFA